MSRVLFMYGHDVIGLPKKKERKKKSVDEGISVDIWNVLGWGVLKNEMRVAKV